MSDKIFLTRAEQVFLMEMLEMSDPQKAVEKFATIITEEGLDPIDLSKYLKKIMTNMNNPPKPQGSKR